MLNELQNLYMITNRMTVQGDNNVACMYAIQSTLAKMIKTMTDEENSKTENNKK